MTVGGSLITIVYISYIHVQLLDKALCEPSQKCFFNMEMLQKFRNFGGVRLKKKLVDKWSVQIVVFRFV